MYQILNYSSGLPKRDVGIGIMDGGETTVRVDLDIVGIFNVVKRDVAVIYLSKYSGFEAWRALYTVSKGTDSSLRIAKTLNGLGPSPPP